MKCCSNDLCNDNCGNETLLTVQTTTKTTYKTTQPSTTVTTHLTTPTTLTKEPNEFWLCFPENYISNDPDYSWYTAIYISSKINNKETTIKIFQEGKMTLYRFNKSITISIDRHMKLMKNKIESKGIRIVSDKNVSVVGFSRFIYFFSGAFNVLPENQLGLSYIAISYHPCNGNFSYNSFINILAANPNTTVYVTLNTSDPLTYNGTTYHSNETFALHMDQFQTFQLSHHYDLTGTRVKGSKPIAVQSGWSCTNNLVSNVINYYTIFLPPVPKLGISFIIPVFLTANKTILRIVPVTYPTYCSRMFDTTGMFKLDKTLEIDIPVSGPSVLTCSNPCLVSVYSYYRDYPFTNLMTIIPSISQYSQNFTYVTPENYSPYIGYDHYISIIIKSTAVGSLMFDEKPVFTYNPNTDYVLLNGISWTVMVLKVNPGYHSITSVKKTYYTAIAHGVDSSSVYVFPIDMNLT